MWCDIFIATKQAKAQGMRKESSDTFFSSVARRNPLKAIVNRTTDETQRNEAEAEGIKVPRGNLSRKVSRLDAFPIAQVKCDYFVYQFICLSKSNLFCLQLRVIRWSRKCIKSRIRGKNEKNKKRREMRRRNERKVSFQGERQKQIMSLTRCRCRGVIVVGRRNVFVNKFFRSLKRTDDLLWGRTKPSIGD